MSISGSPAETSSNSGSESNKARNRSDHRARAERRRRALRRNLRREHADDRPGACRVANLGCEIRKHVGQKSQRIFLVACHGDEARDRLAAFVETGNELSIVVPDARLPVVPRGEGRISGKAPSQSRGGAFALSL